MKLGSNVSGFLVMSKCGNDKGDYYFVVSEEKGFLYLADGKKRTLEAPKKKRESHVIVIGKFHEFERFYNDIQKLESLARNRVLNKKIKEQVAMLQKSEI